MHPQLELLLEIQDLKAQREGLDEESLRDVEAELFEIRIDEAVDRLEEKVRELEERLSPEVRRRYRKIVRRGPRPIVPVLNGICYGCFMAVPTAWASEAARNERIDVCEHCGRFLYHLD